MVCAAIVQARMGSSRLPGKVLRELAGRTVLHHVLDRCRMIPGVDVVICAVPDQVASARLEEIAHECGSLTFRGSELDVLDRYLGAARWIDASVVVRVTSDCPLIDSEICGDVLSLFHRSNADYAANNMPRSFPHGLDCEAFTRAALEEAAQNAVDRYDREHVTPWIRCAPHFRRANLSSENASLKEHRWTLDYPEDLEFFRAVFAAKSAGRLDTMKDVLAVLTLNSQISSINRSRGIAGNFGELA